MQKPDSQLCEVLLDAVSETLANMAFIEVAPAAEPELGQLSDKLMWFGLDILAPYEAKLSLLLPIELAREIAMGTFGMGMDDGISDDMVIDTMAEIVNTVTGVLMTKILPPDKSFELGLPQADQSSLEDTNGLVCGFSTDHGVFCFTAEGGFAVEAKTPTPLATAAPLPAEGGWGSEADDDGAWGSEPEEEDGWG